MTRVLNEARRTIGNTLLYAGLAGLTATTLGGLLALGVGRNPRARALVFSGLLLLLCLPPSLSALGVVFSASHSSAVLDFVLRSRLTVGVVQGLRWVAVGFLLASKSISAASPAWSSAAALHGIGLSRYFLQILFPWLKGALLSSFGLAALLATAEVGSAVLLRPPGADSYPVSIFTIMANAPESLVAASCVLYLLAGGLVLVCGGIFLGRRSA